jgi:hypothetical protein
MRGSSLFLMLSLAVLSGCAKYPPGVGTLVPDPSDSSKVIVIPPPPVVVTESGVIVPPTAPVRTYRGGEG